MRILFLSHYFPPEVNAPANRTYEHARRWAADGHEVTVITGVPNHPRGILFPGYENRWRQEERREGIRVIRTWMYLAPNRGVVRRTLSYALFAAAAALASRRVPNPDVVVATSPQFFCGLAGAVVAKLKGRPFVLEVRDLWPDSIVELGQIQNRVAIGLLRWLERTLYRSAAGIVVNTHAFVEHVVSRGVVRRRVEFIPNGIEPALFHPRSPDAALLRGHGLAGKFIVSYIGTLGLAHGLVTVLEAAERLREDEHVVFVLLGDGADRERLQQERSRRGLGNVCLLGLRPRAEIPGWIASSHVLLVLLRDLPVFATVIPSKLFEFLAQERPVVLAAPRGECRQLLEEAKAGFAIDPENGEKLADAIRQIRAQPEEAAARACAGREWVEANFVREHLARRMAAFLARIAEKRP